MAEDHSLVMEEYNLDPALALNWSKFTVILLSICLGIVMAFAIVGNILVILVIVKHKGMRTRTNLFLCSLAVADFLTGIILMPTTLTTVAHGNWILGEGLCQFTGFMMPLLFVSAIHTLMYMAVHKYLTIIHPFEDYMTKRKTFIMIGASWIWALLIGIFTASIFNHIDYKPNTTQCGPQYPDKSHPKRYVIAGLVIGSCYLVPLCVIVFCYMNMFKVIRQYTHRILETTTLEEEEAFKQQRRITTTLFLVLIAFVIGWTPYITYSAYSTIITDKSKIPALYNGVCYWFGYLNSAVNPIIYAFRSKAFRDGYRSIFCWRRRPKVKDDSHRPGSGRLSRAGIHLKDAIRKRLQSLVPSQTSSANSLAGSASSTPHSRRKRGLSNASLPSNFKFDASKAANLTEIVHQIMDRHHQRQSKEHKMKAEPDSFTLASEDDSDSEEVETMGGLEMNGDIGNKSTSVKRRTIYPAPLRFSPQGSPGGRYNTKKSKAAGPSHKSHSPQAVNHSDIQIVVSDHGREKDEEEVKPTIHYKPHTLPDEHVYLHGMMDEPPQLWSGIKRPEDTPGKRKPASMSEMPEHEKERELHRSLSAKPRRARLPSIEKLDVNFDFRERSKTFDVMTGETTKPKKSKFRIKLRRSFKVFGSQKKKKNKASEPFMSLENLSKEYETGEVFINPKSFHKLNHSCSNPDISIDRMVNVFQERQNAKKLYRKSMKRKNYSSGTEEKPAEVSVRRLSHSTTDGVLTDTDKKEEVIEAIKDSYDDKDCIFNVPETKV